MQELGLPIREFLYFDREKVEDFVSSLESGLPETRKEASTDMSRQINVGFDFKFQAQRKGGTHEVSWEEIRRATPPSLFERLYRRLLDNNAIEMLNPFDTERWHKLPVGGFVEVQSEIRFSVLEMLIDVIVGWDPLMAKLGLKQQMGPDWDKITTYLQALENRKESHNIRIIPSGSPSGFMFVATLPKSKVRASKEELIGNYSVFGRVQRKLGIGETFMIIDLIPGIKLPIEETKKLLDGFQSMPPVLGPPPKSDDLIVSYPAIILTPIAIYR